MPDIESLLKRSLEVFGNSDSYFVSGSLSFLPILNMYREPGHDVDLAVETVFFERQANQLPADYEVKTRRLHELASVKESAFVRFFRFRTGWVHITVPEGLIDILRYRKCSDALVFELGAGLTLEIPRFVEERMQLLDWRGIVYRAAPPEIAFLGLAAALHRPGPGGPKAKAVEDFRRLERVVDRDFVRALAADGGLRLLGHRLPERIDPLADLFKPIVHVRQVPS
ncbi:MAG: hypothetical protein HW412_1378 [Bacteroidetes bacterium]|nr:hypothetical protein [Bacteroidota bacterium]